MATWIVGLIIIAAVYFAAKSILKTQQSGGCTGCSACSGGCSHCTQLKDIDVKK